MRDDSDFESKSLSSLEEYLTTLSQMNDDIIHATQERNSELLETSIHVFSYALEVYKAYLLNDKETEWKKQNLESFSSITFRFVESLKILNDSFFLVLTGRYPVSRILEIVAIESVIKGLFYYGCSINDLSSYNPPERTGNLKRFMEVVQKTKSEDPQLSPLSLEDLVYDECLKVELMHPGLKQMIRQLYSWKLILQDFEDIEEFIQEFKISYRNLSGFIHSALNTTYTYIEKTTELETRVFWGAQFAKMFLEKEIQEILSCVDLLLALILSSLPLEFIERVGFEHLKIIQMRYKSIEDTLVLSHHAVKMILSDWCC